MSATKKNLRLMFDRPSEPIFMPKGEDNVVFQATKEYLAPQYENRINTLSNRFGEEASDTISLKSNIPHPNLTVALQLPRQADFSLFIPKHQQVASSLIDIFLKVPQNRLDDLLAVVAYVRDRVNPQAFNYALSVAMLHREDTRDIDIPNYMETFPSKFIDSRFASEAREVSFTSTRASVPAPIIIPRDFTASNLEIEHRIAYFREDVGVNLHHWHWHLVYPFMSASRAIVNKDRRGELFYYMHQQVLARYNCERLCNSMQRAMRFNNFRAEIIEGYFPKLDSLTSGRSWPSRRSGMAWSDLNRSIDAISMNISDVEQWKGRLEEAISTGRVLLPDGTTQPLTIDALGNMVEASELSPNQSYYGNFHNAGHLFMAYVHDPEHKYLEPFGVMADSGTALRDPFFYRWHAMIDYIFQRFKSSALCPPYTRAELINPNVTVQAVQITGAGGNNTLSTFWMDSDVDMSRGLDFSERGPVLIRFNHLNHRPFQYNVTVNNTGNAKFTTVRIFMAPKNDERGLPLQLSEQRLMFIEMDRFVTQLQRGRNTITRNSNQSSITIPFERTFRDLSKRSDGSANQQAMFNFCGCGWPQHMLVPKGTEAGTPYHLFVMVSNYDLDRINQNTDSDPCTEASSFCGIKDKLYPDRRSMGYPFDRAPNPLLGNISDFLQPNMRVQDITIRHTNRTEPNPRNPST